MKEFFPFRLDLVNQCLWRRVEGADEQRILLTPKAFAMLRYLVKHAGRLVTHEELLEALWPETYVQPEVLKSHVRDIRAVLGDDPRNPRFIETLPRRGYRFLAAVSEVLRDAQLQVDSPASGLVGRNPELARLQGFWQKALHGERQLVFVTGEAGIGKTALVDAFQRRAAAENPGLRIATGQCVEGYGGKEPYYPMLEALGQLCRGPAAESAAQILAAQAPTWLVQFPELIRREQREKLQREIVGATRERMLREIADALETLTSGIPLLLILGNLHWADPSTVDLISALARRRSPGKLMLIGTYRPVEVLLAEHPLKELKQDLLIHHLCQEVALERLTKADVAEYLLAQSIETTLPDGLAALIYRNSEGNPLFMLAALDHMRARGLIAVENGSWQINAPMEEIELEVPETLRELIELQIERLSTEEQDALEVASVTGFSLTANASAPARCMDQEKFESLCEELSRRQHMVRRAGRHQFPDGTISQCYEFAHVLYREVFYRRQAPGRRAKLQLRVGEWVGQASLSA